MKKFSLAIFLIVAFVVTLTANAATCAQGSRNFCVFIQTTTVPISLNLTYQSLNGSGKYVTQPPSIIGPGSTNQFVVQIIGPYSTLGNVRYGYTDDKGVSHGCSISFNCSHGVDQECKSMSATASGSDNTFICKASFTSPDSQNSGTFTLQILNTSKVKGGSSR